MSYVSSYSQNAPPGQSVYPGRYNRAEPDPVDYRGIRWIDYDHSRMPRRSAPPNSEGLREQERCRRCALPPHSKKLASFHVVVHPADSLVKARK
ncbi:hypothetical protein SBV1_270001 [Verrucomicrobia bacterium]|nr:hypothetical protein SBV1_270001 [Verrucomicrobiota bacterium]